MRCGKEKNLEKRGSFVCSFCKGGNKGIPLGWNATKRMCYEIFGRKCAVCGTNKRLCVHHKDKNRGNNSLSNLEIRCVQCHPSKHKTNDAFHLFVYKGLLGNRIVYLYKLVLETIKKLW